MDAEELQKKKEQSIEARIDMALAKAGAKVAKPVLPVVEVGFGVEGVGGGVGGGQ